MTTTPRLYAAIQAETHTVYGVGATAAEARQDAAEWTEHPDRLHVTQITEAAAAYVADHGGAPSAALTVDRNGVCLRSEE